MTTPQERPRVVIVDDHPSVLMAFTRLLEWSCDVVESVSNGPDAIDAARRLRPDVIVVDLMMPDLDGLEVCRQIKRLVPETAVIVVTAFDDPKVQEVAIEAGASAFIAKYAVGDTLEQTIQEIVAGRSR